MPLADILNSRHLSGCERRNYKDHVADCPVCSGRRRVLIREDGDGRVHVGCMRGCLPDSILREWDLDHAALFPKGKGSASAKRPARGWLREAPRYAAGPVRPLSEQ
ncbi:hypothetical protein [Cupriavidus oxalaticus]|uniref:Uncharacterized protein n=1 Tax=Cupriavidus oxalaticus TaxID=96344 RepID=A0A5P3VEA4_9BURK|nr:hypothetical protein [Cupriavidus oxalaticus]QEZ44716.1 hypothetical protein D2917_11040 [Cupriavidus oxalaticus]